MGMLYRLLRDIRLGGRPRNEGAQDGQGGPGAAEPSSAHATPPVRPLLSRPNVRVGLAGALLGCIAGAVAVSSVAPWIVLVLPVVLVAGIVALALDEDRRERRRDES